MSSRRRFLATASALAGFVTFPARAQTADSTPPLAKRAPVFDDYYGTKVSDPYRWMEDARDPDLLPWLKAHDAHTRAFLSDVPGRAALRARVFALSGELSVTRKAVATGQRVFFEQRPLGAQNYKLFVREQDGHAARTLVDPTTLTMNGKHVSLDWWAPDPTGRLVVYGLSPAGSEASTGHVMDVSTGRILEERISNIDYGITGWLPDGSGFFYIQFTGERGTPTFYWNSVVRLHLVSTDPHSDTVFLRRGLYPQIPMKEIQVGSIRPVLGTDRAIVMVLDVRPERAVWTVNVADLIAGRPRFLPLAVDEDLVVGVAAAGDDLFFISNRNSARGRVLVTSLSAPSLASATEVLPQSSVVAEEVYPLRGGALVRMMDGGVQRLKRVTRQGQVSIELPYEGSIREVFSSEQRDDAYLFLTGWLEPPAIWRLASTLKVAASDLDSKPSIDLSPYIAEQRFARARDSTQIPYTIIARRGWQPNGQNTVLATAYGAYQYSLSPRFDPRLLAFLDVGGIYVVGNVRGGGEYGREWHKAGQKATKPNTWRDFIDVSQALIATRVTSSRHLIIQGTSAGGITVGRALTERPDLFAGAISDVGWLNTIRYMAEQNNSDMDEWGLIVDAASFRILYDMDSYHAIKEGVRYPPVLVISGYEDPRVATFNAGKFVARLQAVTTGKSPVLLRIDFDAGHGIGSTREQRDALMADIYTFALSCAGAKGFQTPKIQVSARGS